MPFLRKYGTGTGADVYIPVIKRAVVDFAVSGDWTPASGDVKVSKDGGAAANIGTLPTAVSMGNTAMWKFVFTDAELQCAYLSVTIADSATKAVEDQMFVIETYGNASAMHAFDLDTAVQSVNVTQFGGSNGTFSSGRAEVNTSHWGGTAVGSANVRSNIIQCNGNSVAAGALPNAAAGANGGLPTVNASNYIAGMQGTINTLDALDTAQDAQHGTTQTYLTNNLGTAGAAATEAGGTGDHLTALSVTLKDGAHGGTSATLRLGGSTSTPAFYVTNSGGDAAKFESTGGNGIGLHVDGDGSGAGLRATGGATGNGGHFSSGASAGNGLRIFGASGNALHCEVDANDLHGAYFQGQRDGHGIYAVGGNGDGTGTGHGIIGASLGTGKGLFAAAAQFTTFTVSTNDIAWNAAWDAEVQSECADALTAYGAATSTEVTAIQNNTRVVRVVPAHIERPDSGTTTYRIEMLLYDSVGNMEAPDSAPTLDLVDQGGTDLSARLDSATGALVSTGRYRWIYTASTTDDLEQLVWTFSVVEGGATRLYGNTSLIVDTTAVDFTSADRTKLEAVYNKLPSKNYLTGTANSDGDVEINESTGDFNATQQTRIQTQAAAALTAYDPPTRTEATSDKDEVLTRLGTPAGASVSADILTIDNLVDDLESRLGTPSDLGSGATVAANLADIEGFVDNLPSDPADASDIAASFSTVNSTLATIAAYIDTEVAAIKAKTDNLPAAPAATGDIPTATAIRDAILDRVLAGNHTASGTPGLLLQLLEADLYIDTGTTPWAMVYMRKGTGGIGVGTELLRQSLKSTGGVNLTSTDTVVGQAIAT